MESWVGPEASEAAEGPVLEALLRCAAVTIDHCTMCVCRELCVFNALLLEALLMCAVVGLRSALARAADVPADALAADTLPPHCPLPCLPQQEPDAPQHSADL